MLPVFPLKGIPTFEGGESIFNCLPQQCWAWGSREWCAYSFGTSIAHPLPLYRLLGCEGPSLGWEETLSKRCLSTLSAWKNLPVESLLHGGILVIWLDYCLLWGLHCKSGCIAFSVITPSFPCLCMSTYNFWDWKCPCSFPPKSDFWFLTPRGGGEFPFVFELWEMEGKCFSHSLN